MHEMRHNNYRELYDNFIEVRQERGNRIATLQRQLMPNLVKGTLWLICGGFWTFFDGNGTHRRLEEERVFESQCDDAFPPRPSPNK